MIFWLIEPFKYLILMILTMTIYHGNLLRDSALHSLSSLEIKLILNSKNTKWNLSENHPILSFSMSVYDETFFLLMISSLTSSKIFGSDRKRQRHPFLFLLFLLLYEPLSLLPRVSRSRGVARRAGDQSVPLRRRSDASSWDALRKFLASRERISRRQSLVINDFFVNVHLSRERASYCPIKVNHWTLTIQTCSYFDAEYRITYSVLSALWAGSSKCKGGMG